MNPTESVLIPVGIAVIAAFALGGVFVVAVMGVISFIRAWGRGEPEFSSAMPSQLSERSPLHGLETRYLEGDLDESQQRQQMRAQVDVMLEQRDAERRAMEGGSRPD